jgi:hypothetical protein
MDDRGPDPFGSGWGQFVGFCEHGYEPSGSNKCAEYLGWLRNY